MRPLLLAAVVRAGVLPAQPPAPPDALPASCRGRVERFDAFASRVLGDTRTVAVALPAGYDADSALRYPVVYLHDGQGAFAAYTPPGRGWRAEETAWALACAGRIRPVILVGVWAGAHRRRDYTPFRRRMLGGGGAPRHGRMLVEELKPWVDRAYRTEPGRASTLLVGSSYGGLATLDAGLAHPDVFGRLAVMSPALWWGRRRILASVAAPPAGTARPAIWLDVGAAERGRLTHLVVDPVANARGLRDALLGAGWRLDDSLHYLEAPGDRHDDRAWGRRFVDVLLWNGGA